MPTYDYDVAVIGGGSAGLTVTAGCAQLGLRTLLIEKERELGGDCLHYGCVPSKTLINTARAYHAARNLPRLGLPAAAVGPVEFSKVAAHIRSVIEKILVHDSPERFCGLGAQVEVGTPEFVDEHSARLNGRVVSAAKWVLATGSSPQVPDIPGLSSTPYLTNKHLFSLERLPASLIVLGAGPIAVEMAQAFRRLGASVTVVQRSSQILSKEDKDLADEVQTRLAAEGVVFHLDTRVLRVRDAGHSREVVVAGPDGAERALAAEAILVAQGRVPNVEGLRLDNAGVASSAKGIIVDGRMRTSRKHIFAAGDVTGEWQFTHAAGYEGSVVVSNIAFHLPRKADYAWMPWCTYCEPELASMGLNEKRAKAAGVEVRVFSEPFARNDRSLAENEEAGRVKMLLDAGENLVGVQILGPSAGELLAEWVAVAAGKVKLTSLAGAVHPYPTLAEINKRVVGNWIGPKIFSDKVKKVLGFVFDYRGRACEPADTAAAEQGGPEHG